MKLNKVNPIVVMRFGFTTNNIFYFTIYYLGLKGKVIDMHNIYQTQKMWFTVQTVQAEI